MSVSPNAAEVPREIRCLAAVLSNDYPYTHEELSRELKNRYDIRESRTSVKKLVDRICVMIREGKTLIDLGKEAA